MMSRWRILLQFTHSLNIDSILVRIVLSILNVLLVVNRYLRNIFKTQLNPIKNDRHRRIRHSGLVAAPYYILETQFSEIKKYAFNFSISD